MADSAFSYPPTRRDSECSFVYPSPSKGETKVDDPYNWLEDPKSPESVSWIEEQVAITSKYLNETCTKRQLLHDTVKKMLNYPRVGLCSRHGDRYYFFRNNGLQNQSVLYRYRQANQYMGDHTEENVEITMDPNTFSEDGTAHVPRTKFSKCGRYLAYSVARSGSDWCEIEISDVQQLPSKPLLSEPLQWVKFSGITWDKDAKGIFYSRYDPPKSLVDSETSKGEEVELNENQKLCYHKIGTKQEEDKVIKFDPDFPSYLYSSSMTHDRNSLLVFTSRDCKPENLLSISENFNEFCDGADGLKITPIVSEWIGSFSYIHNYSNFYVFTTNYEAKKYRIICIDMEKPAKENWIELIAEHPTDVLDSVLYVQGGIVCSYLHNATDQLVVFNLSEEWLKSKVAGEKNELTSWVVDLPGPGTVSSLNGREDDPEFFFSFSSFTDPGSIWRSSLADRSLSSIFTTKLGEDAPDLSLCGTKQVWYESKDGTKIPMFVVARNSVLDSFFPEEAQEGKAKEGPRPTLLYGYGGFNISLQPYFSVSRLIFIYYMNGVLCIPNLRGGGEFGQEWHESGTKEKKQNVFDDFIAAAKFLIGTGISSPSTLAINGGSNGGLLVAATINQEPSLFAAGIAQVPVTDMLRYHKFTIGYAWKSDYGSSEEDAFDYLIEYSPLHNVKAMKYPALLVTTADHDDRVVPLHSFKYVATMQHIAGKVEGQSPLLIRIEQKAGHGAGKPISKTIEEIADVWSFIAHSTNCDWDDPSKP